MEQAENVFFGNKDKNLQFGCCPKAVFYGLYAELEYDRRYLYEGCKRYIYKVLFKSVTRIYAEASQIL